MVIIRATTRHMNRHLTESLKPPTHFNYLCCMLQLNSLSHYIVLHQLLCQYRRVVATYPLCHCLSFYTPFFSLVICFIFFDLIIDVCARGFFLGGPSSGSLLSVSALLPSVCFPCLGLEIGGGN